MGEMPVPPSAVSPQVMLLRAHGFLRAHGLRLGEGYQEQWERRLAEKADRLDTQSLDPVCPERLAREGKMAEFLQRCHLAHWLIKRDDDVAGTIFYKQRALLRRDGAVTGKQPVVSQTFGHELAIRLYGDCPDLRLMRPFMLTSLASWVQHVHACGERLGGLWLRLDGAQRHTINLFKKFGYQEISGDAAQVEMILPPASILQLTEGDC